MAEAPEAGTSPTPDADATAALAGLPPGHPLLRCAQEALHRQLAEQKLRLQEELRERCKALKDAKQRREDVGVELYGFQQHLAKLQLSLEQAGDEHAATLAARGEADASVAALRSAVAVEEGAAAARRTQAESLQRDMDRLAGALRAVQAHSEGVASEVAAAKRATYATQDAVTAVQAQKRGQDALIDGMQQQLARLVRQAELHASALAAQRAETEAARRYTTGALSDMEAVAFEKKQLLGQWKASLAAMAKRDVSLEALQEQMRGLEERQAAALSEAEGCRRQLAQQQQRNDAAGEVVDRLQAQAARLAAQVHVVQQRQAELQEGHGAQQQQLAARQGELEACVGEATRLAAQNASLERQQAKLAQDAAAAEQQALERLGDQTFAEKGAQSMLGAIRVARAAIAEKEAAAEQLRAALARLESDAAISEAGGSRLAAELAGLEATLADRVAGVAALEVQIKTGHAAVEAKTRQAEALGRRYQRLLENVKDVETGPLETTIAKLQRDIAAKEAAGRDLQRLWIGMQRQLVAAQDGNAQRAEVLAGMRAQQAVMLQKRARLDGWLEAQRREAAQLAKTLAELRAQVGRLNGLLADASGQRSSLYEGNVALETKLATELQVLEGRWVALSAATEELPAERAEAVAAVVEAERGVLVWERRVQLGKEMQEAVDPAHGNAELAAARKEVARLEHRSAALARSQEALVGELERAVEKREVIGMKARVSQSKRVQEMTATQARRKVDELARALAGAAAAGEQCRALQEQQAAVLAEVAVLDRQRHRALVVTSLRQREGRRYEDALAGRYRPAAPAAVAALPAAVAAEALAEEVQKAQRKQERLRAAVEGLAAAEPAAAPQLERALAHVYALAQ